MSEFLDYVVGGNKIYEYLLALLVFIAAILISIILRSTLLRHLRNKNIKDDSKEDSLIVRIIDKLFIPILYLGALYYALNFLNIESRVFKVLNIIYLVLVTFYIIKLTISGVQYSVNKYIQKTRREEDKPKVKALLSIIDFVIWIIGLLFLIDNLGFKISTFVAGLGITGIAVALAAQAVLGDLFSYFVIFFDKPFEIGDFIIFEDKKGVIEQIGIKTTKLRSLSGEVIVVSNSILTNAKVHNYKKMEKRRVAFVVGVLYQTPYDKIKLIPEVIQKIIENTENTIFDRSHFMAYGDFSLQFETVYFIASSDYKVYMDIHQSILLRIYEEFEKNNIEFAYPTQTLYLNK